MKLKQLIRIGLFALTMALSAAMSHPARAQGQALAPQLDSGASAGSTDSLATPQDKILSQVKWDQKLGNPIPLELNFKDESGQTVKLGQYFKTKPVVLMLIFYDCTMLCSEVMNGSMRLFKDEDHKLGFKLGQDFDVVTVSINPKEGPELAAKKKVGYLKELKSLPEAQSGWHMLTGQVEQIKQLADAVGYHYTYDPMTDTYAHPGGIVLGTPDGKVARYFYGIDFPGKDVRYGMIEASHNKIGSPLERVALFTCFHYNPAKGTYSLGVMKMLRAAAVMTVLGLACGIMLMRRWERKLKTRQKDVKSLGGATPVT